MLRRLLQSLLLLAGVMAGMLLLSNLDKGFQKYSPDTIRVVMREGHSLSEVVIIVPHTSIRNQANSTVAVPYDQTQEYLGLFKYSPNVGTVNFINVDPYFSWSAYGHSLLKTMTDYMHGNLGSLTYRSNPDRAYPIKDQLPKMIARSFSYLATTLIASFVIGTGLALLATWRPLLGRLLDAIHRLIMAFPDFFVVIALQYFAIFLAQIAGHNVILIMQFADKVPFFIPFCAISILPTNLVYGTLRLALQREWGDSYIRTAFSKGLSRFQIILVHTFRNTLEDLLAVAPRAISMCVSSMVVAEVLCGIFGIGGYSLNKDLLIVTSLPATCSALALFVLLMQAVLTLIRYKFIPKKEEDFV